MTEQAISPLRRLSSKSPASPADAIRHPRGPDGNLGGELFAIVAGRRFRRPELLHDVQNGAPALAQQFAPFATRRDCQPDRTQVLAMKTINGERRAGLWRHCPDQDGHPFRAGLVQTTENAIGYE